MYTLITNYESGAIYYDGQGHINTEQLYKRGTRNSDGSFGYWYPSDSQTLNLSSEILNSDFVNSINSGYIYNCNLGSFVTNETSGVPKFENLSYRIAAPLLENNGSDPVNSYNKYWNYSQLEYFIDSLPDWYGDWSSHEFSVYIQSYLQSTEKLAALIQKANDKGWTIYENY